MIRLYQAGGEAGWRWSGVLACDGCGAELTEVDSRAHPWPLHFPRGLLRRLRLRACEGGWLVSDGKRPGDFCALARCQRKRKAANDA